MLYPVNVMLKNGQRAGTLPPMFIIIACIGIALIIPVVSAADAEIETYLGDTVTIKGESYVSDTMYLFFTGPGLPENGVTLTDTSQRADQGHFTIVDVQDDQTWSMRWDTSRVSTSIDPGTYIVYASTEAVDKANLGGSGTYKTLEVWLKDPKTSKVSVSAGASYTLNPEKLSSSSDEVPNLVFTSATPTPTEPLPTEMTTVPTVPPTTATPAPTKTPLLSLTPVLAALVCVALYLVITQNRAGKNE
jgi:hypothetical protein